MPRMHCLNCCVKFVFHLYIESFIIKKLNALTFEVVSTRFLDSTVKECLKKLVHSLRNLGFILETITSFDCFRSDLNYSVLKISGVLFTETINPSLNRI